MPEKACNILRVGSESQHPNASRGRSFTDSACDVWRDLTKKEK
jgi:hypothetical protein